MNRYCNRPHRHFVTPANRCRHPDRGPRDIAAVLRHRLESMADHATPRVRARIGAELRAMSRGLRVHVLWSRLSARTGFTVDACGRLLDHGGPLPEEQGQVLSGAPLAPPTGLEEPALLARRGFVVCRDVEPDTGPGLILDELLLYGPMHYPGIRQVVRAGRARDRGEQLRGGWEAWTRPWVPEALCGTFVHSGDQRVRSNPDAEIALCFMLLAMHRDNALRDAVLATLRLYDGPAALLLVKRYAQRHGHAYDRHALRGHCG